MKDFNKYIFEDYNDSDEISSTFILKNIKHDKLFNKFIKICMKYKIYLFQKKQDDTYELRNGKNLIKILPFYSSCGVISCA
jgi:capsid portal protein